MATNFYGTIADAFGAALGATTNAAALITTGSYQMLFDSAISGGNPGYRVSYIDINTHVLVANFFVCLQSWATPVPLSYITNVGGITRQFAFNTGAIATTGADIMDSIMTAMQLTFTEYCSATIVGAHADNIFTGTHTKPWMASRLVWAVQGSDARQWQVVGVDFSVQANIGAPQLNPQVVASIVGGQAFMLAPPCDNASNAPQLDLDVAINNGANIFSVISRTFTEPGS